MENGPKGGIKEAKEWSFCRRLISTAVNCEVDGNIAKSPCAWLDARKNTVCQKSTVDLRCIQCPIVKMTLDTPKVPPSQNGKSVYLWFSVTAFFLFDTTRLVIEVFVLTGWKGHPLFTSFRPSFCRDTQCWRKFYKNSSNRGAYRPRKSYQLRGDLLFYTNGELFGGNCWTFERTHYRKNFLNLCP